MCCQRRAARVQCATTSATQSVTIQVDGHHDLMVARARARLKPRRRSLGPDPLTHQAIREAWRADHARAWLRA